MGVFGEAQDRMTRGVESAQGLATAFDARTEHNKPLTPYQRRVAASMHEVLFGSRHPDEIAREHAMTTRGGSPQPSASQAAGDAVFNAPPGGGLGAPASLAAQAAPPMPMTHAGMRGSINEMDSPSFPTSNAPLYQGAASPMTPTIGQKTTGQIQGGLGAPAPITSVARPAPPAQAPTAATPSTSGAAPSSPPLPQTQGDLKALLDFAHSGIWSAQQRTAAGSDAAASRERIADKQIQSREKMAAGAEAGKGERQDKNIAMKSEQFDAHQKYLYDALDQAHRDKMAALSKDLKIAADKASKNAGKVDPAFSKELSDLRTRINSVTNDRAKLLSKKADVLSNPAEMDRLQKEVDALGTEKADLMKQFDAISERVNKTPTVSGGGESKTSRIKVQLSNGQKGSVDASEFDPKTMKKIE